MDKRFDPQEAERRISRLWEEQQCARAEIDPEKDPYTVLLPPPNASDPLHIGHAMYVVEDILCRWKRMQGRPTLFLPGTDHAGIETQYIFEKYLTKEGKSRFDFDRQTLYRTIEEFVEKNRGIAKNQLKRLGFSLDWSRERYTLDENVLQTVLETFARLHKDSLIYRTERLANFCTQCGTAFSNLEVEHQEQAGSLWYIRYSVVDSEEGVVVATTRPETMLGDTAVAVHPSDTRYRSLVGKSVGLPLVGREIPIVADPRVDPEFGTGAVKVTPAHDQTDFEIGKEHTLDQVRVVGTDGKITEAGGKYAGQTVLEAREKIVADLEAGGRLEKVEDHTHTVGVCYRCGTNIEPLLMPQWYVDVNSKFEIRNSKLKKLLGVGEASLGEMASLAVRGGHTKVFPDRFEKVYLDWLERIEDWNISRQIVWGPRIPAWYCLDCHPEILVTFVTQGGEKVSAPYAELKEKYAFAEIEQGLQKLVAPVGVGYQLEAGSCDRCDGEHTLQETDTFDTWFSSGQWPLTTLGFPDGEDFEYFYPTSVLDTMWDILFFWVVRMMMFGLYLAGDVPFKVAHMHARVVDERGRKMSKSKGNVVDPLGMVDEYGVDALRFALVYGTAPGGDVAISEDKIRAMRNFANKIWNIGRFALSYLERDEEFSIFNFQFSDSALSVADRDILGKLDELVRVVDQSLEKYRFSDAALAIYEFAWHQFADKYVEGTKGREDKETTEAVLLHVYTTILKLLHPFMPFVTEAVWQELREKGLVEGDVLMVSEWPRASNGTEG